MCFGKRATYGRKMTIFSYVIQLVPSFHSYMATSSESSSRMRFLKFGTKGFIDQAVLVVTYQEQMRIDGDQPMSNLQQSATAASSL